MGNPHQEAGARRAQDFLELIESSKRGKLKIYIGSAAGVGKTYRMLQEAHALREKGVDVVLGFVETHGRAETQALVGDLEVIPRTAVSYRGVALEEMDLEAILARRPQVVVVDELAHSNAPGQRNEKRYQDVLDLVRAGVNVLTAVNIQHLESLNDVVSRMTGVQIRETLPDAIVRRADQVVNIDLSVEDLRERLTAGKIYAPEKIERALGNFFDEANLSALRELALREVAETAEREAERAGAGAREAGAVDTRRGIAARSTARPGGKVMLAISTHAQGAELVRKASRIAGRLNLHWYAVHVERPGEERAQLEAPRLRALTDDFELARSLGAEVIRLRGKDVAATLLAFARENGVERLVLGKSSRRALAQRLFGSLLLRILDDAEGIDVQIVSVGGEEDR